MTDVVRVTLVPAFVLHTRPYRNTSLIVELLTATHGRITLIARSARGPKSRYRGRIQPFSPLVVSWFGRGELKNLNDMELCGLSYDLKGHALLCGFYLNELLLRFLKGEDACPSIYASYQEMLHFLEKETAFEVKLRYFEKNLFKELGYGLVLNCDAERGDAIRSTSHYRYVPEKGFIEVMSLEEKGSLFSGAFLSALDQECLQTLDDLRAAKRLMRMALSWYLGDKPIFSRELLI